jgi:hypothetical protein
MMAVAGRNEGSIVSACARPPKCGPTNVGAPQERGPDYMKESSVTVGRAGRLSVHTLDERAHGMRGTVGPPSCMRTNYRPLWVVT